MSHAVSRLAESGLEIAGASVLYIYFAREQQIAVAGPYGPNHATAATMAYRRRYADQHRYDDGCALGEEPVFTNGYSEPMVQLEPVRTMLCIAHVANSFGKSRVDRRPTGYGLKDFVSWPRGAQLLHQQAAAPDRERRRPGAALTAPRAAQPKRLRTS